MCGPVRSLFVKLIGRQNRTGWKNRETDPRGERWLALEDIRVRRIRTGYQVGRQITHEPRCRVAAVISVRGRVSSSHLDMGDQPNILTWQQRGPQHTTIVSMCVVDPTSDEMTSHVPTLSSARRSFDKKEIRGLRVPEKQKVGH